MKVGTRLFAALLALTLLGGARAAAQDEGSDSSGEFGVGLYLGNCDSLVEGAALYDLGDAELETEDFGNTDENTDENAEEGEDLEGELAEESSEDETDVESAVEGGDEGSDEGSDDSEVVVQSSDFLVYVSANEAFGAELVDLVDAPFAVAIRQSAQDEAEGDTEGDTEGEGDGMEDFVSCGEFGGAVAGDEIVIPLESLNDSGFSGIAILTAGEGEGESTASVYLVGNASEDGGEDEESSESEGEGDATPEA